MIRNLVALAVYGTESRRLIHVGTEGTEIAFEWITSDVVFRMRDQTGADISGGQLRLLHLPGSPLFGSATTVTLPVTDETIYPTMFHIATDGYTVFLYPLTANGPLIRQEESEVTTTTTEIVFEWIQLHCAVQVVDIDDESVPGSTLILPHPFPAITSGDDVALPITDEFIYPTMFGASIAGYATTVTPGDIAPTSGTFDFEVLGSLEFSPPSFVIGGNTYSLACITDSDGDGLLDTTELDIAEGSGCPDPFDADSDNDGLLDGEEIALGTNPCNPDSDGDGVPDNEDPLPTEPGVTQGFVEDLARELCATIQTLDLSLFNGPNENANEGRRNSLANRACNSANAIANEHVDSAIAHLEGLLDKIDGIEQPPDWMHDSPEKTALAAEVELLIALLLL